MNADELTRLLAERDELLATVEKLRTALQHIADGCTGLGNQAQWAGNVARKALKGDRP